MVDEIDRTENQAGIYHKMNLASSKRPSGPEPTGACLYCDDPLDGNRRWCSPECRDDWERENRD